MSDLALKILAEFRALPAAERAEVAAAVTREARADAAERLRVLEAITGKYRSGKTEPVDLNEAWVEGILPDKRTA